MILFSNQTVNGVSAQFEPDAPNRNHTAFTLIVAGTLGGALVKVQTSFDGTLWVDIPTVELGAPTTMNFSLVTVYLRLSISDVTGTTDVTAAIESSPNEFVGIDPNGVGLNSSVSGGFQVFSDLATTTTPLAAAGGATTVVPNDALGAQTLLTPWQPSYLTVPLWDASTSSFDWSDVPYGTIVQIRLDVTVTTTANNQFVELDLNNAIGGFPYLTEFTQNTFKTVGTYQISRTNIMYVVDSNTGDNPSQFVINTDANATVVVAGWVVHCTQFIQ
tara:strand:- start:200 stop:1021 length:822 start_codon:yes stop_codon:yes gene_type:complete